MKAHEPKSERESFIMFGAGPAIFFPPAGSEYGSVSLPSHLPLPLCNAEKHPRSAFRKQAALFEKEREKKVPFLPLRCGMSYCLRSPHAPPDCSATTRRCHACRNKCGGPRTRPTSRFPSYRKSKHSSCKWVSAAECSAHLLLPNGFSMMQFREHSSSSSLSSSPSPHPSLAILRDPLLMTRR